MPAPRHIVCVTGFIRDEEGRVLLIKSPRRGWELPGGQVEENEALAREIEEETGFTVSVQRLAGVYTSRPKSLLIFCFLGRKASGTARASAESLEVAWFSVAEARRLIEWPSMRLRFDDLANSGQEIVYRIYNTEPFSVASTATWSS